MGGLGAALALARQGFKHIDVWESASSLGEVGAGINITPNLSRILANWDVYDYVKPEGVPLKSASVISELQGRGWLVRRGLNWVYADAVRPQPPFPAGTARFARA